MSANQELPLTGASTAAVGVIGAIALSIGALLVTAAQWGARTRRRFR
ncbi:LPXTG cell wall anchor domain-containing protein [Micromonospora sp. PLK6-60]|nr:LPXTG cell wall anchor domain-containing protein [Micromonospora sp. PLK6-60]MBY8872362.1 LPXTG cell wall anchor domain-containing protein [Micromonospora sp. PLK6-60]